MEGKQKQIILAVVAVAALAVAGYLTFAGGNKTAYKPLSADGVVEKRGPAVGVVKKTAPDVKKKQADKTEKKGTQVTKKAQASGEGRKVIKKKDRRGRGEKTKKKDVAPAA